uniref:Glutathione S-transferase n=1 Tax=Panagrolaimus sp. ES5 TaxID=591445 RepID=A0AC34GQJ4_9BILA
MTMVFWIILLLIVIGLFLKFYLFAGTKEPVLKKTDWKKDVVYLYQFKRNIHVPNLSPFCMKIETFTRANKIDYEVVEGNFNRSHKGLLPFIELNGEQIADSEFIIYKLAEKFNVKENLSKEKAGSLRALSRMFDEEVFRIQMKYKIQSEDVVRIMLTDLPDFLIPLIHPIIRIFIGRRISASGYGAHSDEELLQMYRRDLQAAVDILGDNKFFGGDKLVMADCVVYGQLASLYLLPSDTLVHEVIRKEFPKLGKYVEDVTLEYYSDFPCAKKLTQ